MINVASPVGIGKYFKGHTTVRFLESHRHLARLLEVPEDSDYRIPVFLAEAAEVTGYG